MTMRGATDCLLVLSLLTVCCLPLGDATLAEGNALFKMMQQWDVSLPGWSAMEDPCSVTANWTGVSCRNGAVVELNVTNSGITGSLPQEIGNLQYLEVLDISNVYQAPAGFKNNSLSGPFPDSFAQCTNLKSFNASNINWNIDFPSVFSKFPALEELYFSLSLLNGTIPDDFYTNLVNLRYLFLGNNGLKGDLQKMTQLKNLVLLAVSQNDFTGVLPDDLGNLEKLEYLNCHTCKLYGGLPDSLAKLKSLRNITLQRNTFTGPIPDSWRNLSDMRGFRIDQNYLTGQFPEWMFTAWPKLTSLQLTKNRFSGMAPNINNLDTNYNVSYTYSTLKWDCNYLNGPEPCTDTSPCKNQTTDLLDDNAFEFGKNCYNDASASDLSKVETDCSPSHPTDKTCLDFYSLGSGKCFDCPPNQVLWPEAGQCVCRIAVNAGSSKKKGGVPVGAVVGGVLGLVAAFTVILGLVLYKRRKHFSWLDIFTVKGRRASDNWEAPPGVERFSLEDLSKVTHNFSDANVIGQGGFGKVFVGTLADGRMVAIKRAPAVPQHDNNEFHNEVTLLSRLHHRNLVKLEGFCDDDGLQILVYEFVQNGNLHAHLLGKLTTTPLHWYRRLEIAYGVAQGLEYLHSFADPPVIHRDVKPSNILLDNHMVAKLADFGISKVNPEHDTHVSTRPAGTAGYLDPDYFMRRQLTSASDVYAFGVVLLELVTGQEAIDHMRLEEFNLIEWVKKRFKTSGIVSVIDPLIVNDYNPETYTEMAALGLRCASFDRHQRPNMKAALAILEPLMVMQNLYPEIDKKDLGKNSHKKIHIAFDTEYLPEKSSEQTLINDHTSRSTESNPSEIGIEVELMSGRLRPR